MNRRKRIRSIFLVPLSLIALSGGIAYLAIGDAGVPAAAGSERLAVSFDEWTVEPETTTIEEGRTTFAVENRGEVDHELLVLRTDEEPSELPQGIAGPVAELVGELEVGEAHDHAATNDSYAVLDRPRDEATEDHIAPGETVAIDAELEPGSYVLYCNLPGHYQRGQYAALEVVADEEADR